MVKDVVYYNRFKKRTWAYESDFVIKLNTYSSRSGVRNPSIILHPAMVCTFLMSIWAIKNRSDVSHAIHTNSRAFEDGAERKQHDSILPSFLHWTLIKHKYERCCRQDVGMISGYEFIA